MVRSFFYFKISHVLNNCHDMGKFSHHWERTSTASLHIIKMVATTLSGTVIMTPVIFSKGFKIGRRRR